MGPRSQALRAGETPLKSLKFTIKSVWLKLNSQVHAVKPNLFTASGQVEISLFCTPLFIGCRKNVGIYCFRTRSAL